jgi:hypothetical protein
MTGLMCISCIKLPVYFNENKKGAANKQLLRYRSALDQ